MIAIVVVVTLLTLTRKNEATVGGKGRKTRTLYATPTRVFDVEEDSRRKENGGKQILTFLRRRNDEQHSSRVKQKPRKNDEFDESC